MLNSVQPGHRKRRSNRAARSTNIQTDGALRLSTSTNYRVEIMLTIKHGFYPIHGHDTKKCRVKVVSLLQCVLRSCCCQPMSYLCILQLNRFLGFLSSIRPSTQPPPAPLITTFYSGSFAPYTLFYILLLLTLAWFCMTFKIIFQC